MKGFAEFAAERQPSTRDELSRFSLKNFTEGSLFLSQKFFVVHLHASCFYKRKLFLSLLHHKNVG